MSTGIASRTRSRQALPFRQSLSVLLLTGDGDLVFNRGGEHLNHYDLRKRFYAALDRAELRRIRFHDLRHCFGSTAITALNPYAVRATWATSITRPPSATSTTSRAARMRPDSPRRLGINLGINLSQDRALRTTQSKTPVPEGGSVQPIRP